MNFSFDTKHRAVHFDKILRNTSKEIKSIHGFPPRKAFDIPISQAKICGDRADVSSPSVPQIASVYSLVWLPEC